MQKAGKRVVLSNYLISNVMVGRDYLAETMRRAQDPSVGLVSNMIRGVGGRSIGAVLEIDSRPGQGARLHMVLEAAG